MSKTFNKLTSLILGTTLAATVASAAGGELQKVMKARGLTENDVIRAAKTYLPTGGRDEYVVFSSGGQSGQIMVYGVPSMKILKYIGVFTPEPWQGWGYDDDTKKVLAQGKYRGKQITWGDTHHPAISETNGKYDGKWLVINDKANPRLAVIDLEDFETKQIVVNPVFKSDHGGAFFTPNSEYILEACQYAAPFDNNYHPIEEYKETYRGGITMWKFDGEKGRIAEKDSFTLELPPYMQDLSDAGKGASYGLGFTNSFNSELYTGGIEKGLPPFEAGCSRNDTDFLHVYNWKKLAELAKDDKNVKIINDFCKENNYKVFITSSWCMCLDDNLNLIDTCSDEVMDEIYKTIKDNLPFIGKDPFNNREVAMDVLIENGNKIICIDDLDLEPHFEYAGDQFKMINVVNGKNLEKLKKNLRRKR